MVGHEGMADTFAQGHGGMDDPFTHGQDGLGSTFPQDHKFPEDYRLEEEDNEVGIDREPLFFEDELSIQANANKKRQSIHTKAYTKDEGKLICKCWKDIGQDPNIGAKKKGSTFWLKVHA